MIFGQTSFIFRKIKKLIVSTYFPANNLSSPTKTNAHFFYNIPAGANFLLSIV